MAALMAFAGLILPWLAGASCALVLLAPARERMPWVLALGYGWPAGALLTAIWMNALSLAGIKFSFALVAIFLLVVAGIATYLCWKRARVSLPFIASDDAAMSPSGLSGAARLVWYVLCFILLARSVQLLMEILWRPTYPWDAWAHWATKAHAWFSTQSMAPFGFPQDLLAGSVAYTDANPHYPSGAPLVQTWMALSIGAWDDTLVNLPWFAWAIAMACAFYARIREEGSGPLFAAFACYLLLSLPFLETHVALPGYADLPLADSLLLAFMAFRRWTQTHSRRELVLAGAFALSLPLLKNPGWVWLALFVPALIVAFRPQQGLRLAGAGLALGIVALLVLSQTHPRLLGYELHTQFQPVWGALLTTTLLFNNWHLLWYLAPLILLISWRRLFQPELAPLTVYLMAGFFFLFVVFFFSNAAIWVTDFSTANRALLQLVPSFLFYLVLLTLDWRRRMMARAPIETDGAIDANAA